MCVIEGIDRAKGRSDESTIVKTMKALAAVKRAMSAASSFVGEHCAARPDVIPQPVRSLYLAPGSRKQIGSDPSCSCSLGDCSNYALSRS